MRKRKECYERHSHKRWHSGDEIETSSERAQTLEPHAFSDGVAEEHGVGPPRIAPWFLSAFHGSYNRMR
jgi:hypothetical protein